MLLPVLAYPRKVGFNFGQLFLCLTGRQSLGQPRDGIFAVLAIIAAVLSVAQRDNVGWGSTRATRRSYGYPMVGNYSMPQARSAPAYSTPMIPIIKAILPIGFSEVSRKPLLFGPAPKFYGIAHGSIIAARLPSHLSRFFYVPVITIPVLSARFFYVSVILPFAHFAILIGISLICPLENLAYFIFMFAVIFPRCLVVLFRVLLLIGYALRGAAFSAPARQVVFCAFLVVEKLSSCEKSFPALRTSLESWERIVDHGIHPYANIQYGAVRRVDVPRRSVASLDRHSKLYQMSSDVTRGVA